MDAEETNSISEVMNTFYERNGRYQRILILLLCLSNITVGINHTVTTFHIYVPKFFCLDEPTQTCDVIVNGTECPSGYEFDEEDDRSVAVEWSLVCDKRLLAPLVNSIYFVGVTLGAFICSTLCDVWGRKKLVIACLYAPVLMALGQYFSNSLELFLVFRFIQGYSVQGLHTCAYTLMLEYCPSKFRTIAATVWAENWTFGLALLSAASYFIRNWRELTIVLTLPAVLSIFYSWIIPESIPYLYAKGEKQKAMQLILRIAKFNKSDDIIEQCNSINLADLNQVDDVESTNAPEVKPKLSDIFRNPVLRKHLLAMVVVWFAVTLSYYGTLYFLPNLAGQRHLNFLIGATIEFAANFLAYFAFSRIGRRIPMAFYQYMNGVLLLIIGIVTTVSGDSPNKVWCLIIILLLAKGMAVSSFCGMCIYASELFPTSCRGFGIGVCGLISRCGSLLAPQLMAMMYYLTPIVPMSVMAIILLISGTMTLYLPETLHTPLPNTISESDAMWGSREQ